MMCHITNTCKSHIVMSTKVIGQSLLSTVVIILHILKMGVFHFYLDESCKYLITAGNFKYFKYPNYFY